MEFERLIETERRNDELLARARAEAAASREAARTAAEQRESRLEAELAAAVRASDEAFAAQRARRLAEIAGTARAAAARFDAVGDDLVRAVAATLVEQLVREGSAA